MNISARTTVNRLVDEYPFLIDFLVSLSPRYALLRNPVARSTVGRVATLAQAASIGGLQVDDFVARISAEIERHTGVTPGRGDEIPEVEPISDPDAKHEMLKAIIRSLHEGGDVEEARRQFAALVRDVDASEIAAMEQRLIAEGMSPEEVKRLCDVHVKVFQESIESGQSPQVPEGHPVHTFMAENRALERILARLEEVLAKIGAPVSQAAYEQYATNIDTLFASLRNVHVHYLRKENQLFPLLERHAITGPTQVMWSLDDDIRGMIKTCISAHGTRDAATLKAAAKDAIQALRDMIYKEERILFPMSLETLCDTEWDEIRAGEGDIGYAWISPSDAAPASQNNGGAGASPDTVRLDTGALTVEQINLMLTNLPIDLSFVNEHDEVRYYSATRDRIFPRSPAVIGRTVQNCHPPKSMPRVQEILDAFRAGTTNEAEFWIQLNGAFIHIRYFALRDAKGSYRGCLEVSQDVTAIRALAGERRLLE